ncbi:hypothetical protein EDD15DRAFT_1066507 [Pisolithus albus]|nr:hypothetical protein EDD15DRAFT_1066507 [Pisolithus albus]
MSLSQVKHLFAHSSKSHSLPRSTKPMGGLPRQEADRSSTPCWTGRVYNPTPVEMTPLSVLMTKRFGNIRPRHRQSTKLRLAKAVSSCVRQCSSPTRFQILVVNGSLIGPGRVGNSSPRASQHKVAAPRTSFNLPLSLASPKSPRQPAIRGSCLRCDDSRRNRKKVLTF